MGLASDFCAPSTGGSLAGLNTFLAYLQANLSAPQYLQARLYLWAALGTNPQVSALVQAGNTAGLSP